MSWHNTISSILNQTSANLNDKRSSSSLVSPCLLRKTLSSTFTSSRLSHSMSNLPSSTLQPEFEPKSSSIRPSTSSNIDYEFRPSSRATSATTDLRIAECTTHLERLYDHFDAHQNHLETELESIRQLVHSSVGNVRTEFAPLKKTVLDSSEISRLSREVTNLNTRIDSLSKSLTTTITQVNTLSSRFSHGDLPALSGIRQDISELQDSNNHRLNELDQKVIENSSGQQKSEEELSRVKKSLETLQSQCSDDLGTCYAKFDDRVKKEINEINLFLNENLSRQSNKIDQMSDSHSRVLRDVDDLLLKHSSLEVKTAFLHLLKKSPQLSQIGRDLESLKESFSVQERSLLKRDQQSHEFESRLQNHEKLLKTIEESLQNQPETFQSIISKINNLNREVNNLHSHHSQSDVDDAAVQVNQPNVESTDEEGESFVPEQRFDEKVALSDSEGAVTSSNESVAGENIRQFENNYQEEEDSSSDEEVERVEINHKVESRSEVEVDSDDGNSVSSVEEIKSVHHESEQESDVEEIKEEVKTSSDVSDLESADDSPIKSDFEPDNSQMQMISVDGQDLFVNDSKKSPIQSQNQSLDDIALNDDSLDWLGDDLSDLSDLDIHEPQKNILGSTLPSLPQSKPKEKSNLGLSSLNHDIPDLSDLSDVSFSLSPTLKKSSSSPELEQTFDLSKTEGKNQSGSESEEEATLSEPFRKKLNFAKLNLRDPDPLTPLKKPPFEIPKAGEFDDLSDLSDSSFDF
ncbi:hypothetical protein GEMRC1_006668 [Eukaryota sp. GEM-RC1]